VATPVIIVLAIVAMVSFVAIAAVVSQLIARLRRLKHDLVDIEKNVMPMLEQLQRDAEVTGRELERLGQALDDSNDRVEDQANLVGRASGAVDSMSSDGPLVGPDLTRQEKP
jgi:methyl-accepting chemotaxis protein